MWKTEGCPASTKTILLSKATGMDTRKLIEKTNPFGALIAVSSLIAALLYVAGFSYRWAYFYNFGVQHIVFKLNFQSFLITAIELIRDPSHLLLSVPVIVISLILINTAIRLITVAANAPGRRKLNKTAATVNRLLGLENSLVVDTIRAVVILYVTYMLSSHVGYTAFQRHIVNSPENTLPAVTAIIDKSKEEGEFALSCGAEEQESLQLIGDLEKVRIIQDAFRTCNTKTRKWRLLYRDDKSIYLFASEPAELIKGKRPLTIILPNTAKTYLVME